MKFLGIFLFLLVLTINAFPQKPVSEWKISDYLKNLPENYQNFGNNLPPTNKTTIIDNKNGYAAYMDSEEEYAHPLLEMALFKPQNGTPTLVVSNPIYDHDCVINNNYFLQVKDNRWIDVKDEVLPRLDFSMIFIDGKNDITYKYYQKMQKKYGEKLSGLEYVFSPPRIGTKMEVNLYLCGLNDDRIAQNEDLESFEMIPDSFKPIYLQWNKSKGKFEVAKN